MHPVGIPRRRGCAFAPVMALFGKTVTLDNQDDVAAWPRTRFIRSHVRKPDGARVRWDG